MNAWRFILASLRQYRRVHIAVALGVAVATAVLTGALLVGDSVRGSLRDLTLERLGTIDTVLVAGHPFRASLADELAKAPDFEKHFASAEPALLLNGTLQAGSGKAERHATGISVVGFAPSFWSLGQGGPEKNVGDDEVAITEPVARDLGVKAGDDILLRIPAAKAIPGDSTLGEKSDISRSQTLKVSAVLPVDGLARFSIAPSQQLPRNAFVPLATLQKLFQQEGNANAILVASSVADRSAGEGGEQVLDRGLHPALGDYGVSVKELSSPAHEFQISADQLVLPTEVMRAAEKVFAADSLQPVSTYLANTISVGDGAAKRKIPYSTITGVDSKASIGPLLDDKGQPIVLADDEIVLNRWAADDLHAKVGDVVTVTFYEPESTHGNLHEHEPAPTFKLRAIAELKTAGGKPTAAADPQLTPESPGVTDQKSISDWDLPFKLVETVRKQDEDYWRDYRTTPKAFVSLATAKRLRTSRWGAVSLLRLPVGKSSVDETAELLQREVLPSALGIVLLPVKEQGLAASAGTTPFEALFIGFSFFLIAAAIMLVALLFQLGVEQRATELGTLGAIGIGRRIVTRLLAGEGMIVAAVGATCGVLLGVCYAALMIFGLRTWWLAAISTPFLRLHVSALSLVIGWLVGVAVSGATIWWSIRRLVRRPVRQLVSGGAAGASSAASKSGRGWWRLASWPVLRLVFAVLVVVQCVAGFYLTGESQAGVFFGSGAAMLVLLLGEVRYRLRNLRPGSGGGSFSLLRLSALNTARNAGRSTLTIGLVAAASFLILAVSAFHLNTGEGGTGGFDLIATSDMPIHFDLNTAEGRRELGVSDSKHGGDELSDEELLSACKFYAFRVAAGENASCLNLYQPKQPRVLGVPESFIDHGGRFDWSAVEKRFASAPWSALDAQLGTGESGEEIVPVVLDASTAIYSLHLDGIGSRLPIRDSADRNVTLQVVGLLENSVLQGSLLVSEKNFLKMYPDVAGYKMFLILQAGGALREQRVAAALNTTLAEEGFDALDAREQLAQFLAVQNTYLSTFQSLGALGLLLGTVGLAVVQLRSVLERRAELALMRAEGFRPARLIAMVIGENAVLLLGGLAVGSLAAAIALIPQWMPHGAGVPWGSLAALLSAIAIVGLLAGWLAMRSTVRTPIVASLRGD